MQKLRDIFDISTGYTFRSSVAELAPGKVALVQAGDINAARLAQVPRVAFDGSQHLLQVGDILLSVRGGTTARTVTIDLLPAVAASSILVLRPKNDRINTKFIAQYLNSKHGQSSLTKIMSGAYIKTIRKSELEELLIPIPPPGTQQTLVALGDTVERYQQVVREKETLLTTIYDQAIRIKGTTQ